MLILQSRCIDHLLGKVIRLSVSNERINVKLNKLLPFSRF